MTIFFGAWLVSKLVDSVFIRHLSLATQAGIIIPLLLLAPLKALIYFIFDRFFHETALNIKDSVLKDYMNGVYSPSSLNGPAGSTGAEASAVCEASDYIEPYYYEYIPAFFVLSVSLPLILISVLAMDPVSFAIMLVTAPILPVFLGLIGSYSGKMNEKRLDSLLRLGGSFLDLMNGMKTLKVFGQSRNYSEKVYENSEQFRKLTMEVLKVSFLSAFVLELAATISTAIIAVSLGLRLMYGNLDFFEAFFILLVTPDYFMAIRRFGAKFHLSMTAAAADKKLRELVVNTGDAISQSAGVKPSKVPLKEYSENPLTEYSENPSAGTFPGPFPEVFSNATACLISPMQIEFQSVSVRYDSQPNYALDSVELVLEAGKMTALTGRSGSGKSTLANTLLKFVEPCSGAILVNKKNIRDIEDNELRGKIAYIPQRPFIFAGTLLENLRLGKPDASLEEVSAAVKSCALESFVTGLPNGLSTELGENGSTLSYGEIQRIAIARAVLKNSPFVIIDEATSALDRKNEHLIRQAFEQLRKSRTLLVIAHKLETVETADTIMVLENGRLVQSGTHSQLLTEDGEYRKLIEAWR
ncbi:MAG: thiol reductant ABC exporter subunit CydD [Clostridiales bacterium]|nr:thiol reductant ABC exporter subunit CydD [Clostridiales bacterium]